MKRLARPFWVALALIFLFEAWLWDVLQPIVGRIVNVIPWGKIKPAFLRMVERLSPEATLVVFAIPFVILLPVNVLEFWLLAHGQWFAAIIVMASGKLIGLGLTAFIIETTKEKLLQMTWFQRLYEFFMWARDWADEKIEPVKRQLREWWHETIDPIARQLRQWRQVLQRRHAGRLFQWVMRIRRRMRTAASSTR